MEDPVLEPQGKKKRARNKEWQKKESGRKRKVAEKGKQPTLAPTTKYNVQGAGWRLATAGKGGWRDAEVFPQVCNCQYFSILESVIKSLS